MKFLILAASILAAVCNHQIVDALAAMGLFHSEHAEYRHVAMLPAMIAAVTVFIVVLAVVWLDGRHDDGVWLLRLARAMRAIPLGRTFLSVTMLQFVVLFAMESIEQLLWSGRLADPAAWLGASLPLALTVGTFVAACVTALLRSGCDAIVRASQAIERLWRAFVVAVRARHAVDSIVAPRRAQRKSRASSSLLAFRSGLRAPPGA